MWGLKAWLPIPILPLAVRAALGTNLLLSETQFRVALKL